MYVKICHYTALSRTLSALYAFRRVIPYGDGFWLISANSAKVHFGLSVHTAASKLTEFSLIL
jgi:hypothetical protein